MDIKIKLSDESVDCIEKMCELFALDEHMNGVAPTIPKIVSNTIEAAKSEWAELLGLVNEHPELRADAKEILLTLYREPLTARIKQIAPPGYEMLSERRRAAGGKSMVATEQSA
ncbi:hypothetical protein [Massilia sp. TS11]|uniref:hypothetical protein n=1 Tax=Massilia sp. TS11 TaxID=2908003 RepID=UPI001EDB5D19|nr:hypothetical protein [Massilia sp. TS11]MCG2583508.1 hypothetical protein [Massilia sp. TS11]